MQLLRKISLFFLSFLFIGAGVYHFINPAFYLNIMPPWLPEHHLLNTVAGVAEIALGILLWTKLRRTASLLLVVMLLLFFLVHVWHLTPGGMAQVQAPSTLLWVRFAGQFVLIGWVWWAGKK